MLNSEARGGRELPQKLHADVSKRIENCYLSDRNVSIMVKGSSEMCSKLKVWTGMLRCIFLNDPQLGGIEWHEFYTVIAGVCDSVDSMARALEIAIKQKNEYKMSSQGHIERKVKKDSYASVLRGATTCRTSLNAQKIEEQHGNKKIGNVSVRGNGNKVFGNPGKFQQVARPGKGLGSQRQRVDDVDYKMVWKPTTQRSRSSILLTKMLTFALAFFSPDENIYWFMMETALQSFVKNICKKIVFFIFVIL